MKIRRLLCLLFLGCVIPAMRAADSSPPPAAPAEWLDARLREEVASFRGTVVLFAKNLDTGATYSLGGDDLVRTASTIKVAVLIAAFAAVHEGRVQWTDRHVVTAERKVGGSGILNAFEAGLPVTFRDAVHLMMLLSDNTATNLVIDAITAEAVNRQMEALGLTATRLMRKIGGGGDSADGKKEENRRFGIGRSTPHEMVLLLEKLERGEVVSVEASKEMLALMKREHVTNGIWRALWNVPKATKSGALDRLRSNVGLIYHPRGRIALAITCDDVPEITWTADHPALLLMSRMSEQVIEGLGR